MDSWIDEFEADLGRAARLRLIANCGGQNRDVPSVARAGRSKLAAEIGEEATLWLARRFAGTTVAMPSMNGQKARDQAARLRAAILDAGLTEPTRSANDIAAEFDVTATWVYKLRGQMQREANSSLQLELPFN
tara:strand:- start:19864 stop:20262 length:399 start_codon:yes stop_codon:yes gene_type:complete